jgi:hypothetical protein
LTSFPPTIALIPSLTHLNKPRNYYRSWVILPLLGFLGCPEGIQLQSLAFGTEAAFLKEVAEAACGGAMIGERFGERRTSCNVHCEG